MLKIYTSGKEFLEDNKDILEKYPLETVFFEANAKYIEKTNKNNFLAKVAVNGRFLIAVHNARYPMVLFGDKSLCAEFADGAYKLKLTFDKVLSELETCEAFLHEYEKLAKCSHAINHSMDIMRCDSVLTDNVEGVEMATEDDVDELAELSVVFAKEALGDDADIDEVKHSVSSRLSSFRLIRQDGRIVSFASKKRGTDKLSCIADVYTLPSYRGQGLSCKIVTALTKQILDSGKLPYLFVDKTNPVSNHLYTKIGYTYAVPQYEIKIIR